VIWLDALDNPFGQFFGAIFRENYPGETHPVSQIEGAAAARYGSNLMPLEYRPQHRASPLLVYPYDRTREALERVVRSEPLHPAHGAKMRYANPNDGGYVYPTLAVFIQWMPKGFSGQTYRSTDGAVFNVVEGRGRAHIGETDFTFEPHDVFVIPPWTSYYIVTESECVLFSYSDRAAQETLGFWREQDPLNRSAA
jgi:gentisate 1,2-dioxygenase